jgi:uncharacterized RDD family membrane protein YckC
VASVNVNTPYNVQVSFELAGLDKRLFAWLLDLGFRYLLFILFRFIFTAWLTDDTLDRLETSNRQDTIYLAAMLPIIFYFFIFETLLNGQTIGKKLLGIRVVSIEDYKPTFTQYFLRWTMRLIDLGFISILYLGMGGLYNTWMGAFFLIPNLFAILYTINSKKEQRLGDAVSGTVVIRLRSQLSLADTIFRETSKTYNVTYNNVLKLSDRDITIIKNALENYHKSGYDNTLWLIAQKLQQVLKFDTIDDPYHVLNTILEDYNHLSTN